MRRTPFVHPLAIVAALATAAGAADMSKTQLADLKKVSRKIDQVERTVESLEKSKTRGTPAFSDAAASKRRLCEGGHLADGGDERGREARTGRFRSAERLEAVDEGRGDDGFVRGRRPAL